MEVPVHPRVDTSLACSTLMNSTLQPFQIVNRKNTLVYREHGGNVFYMEVLERAQGLLTEDEEDALLLSRSSCPSFLSVQRPASPLPSPFNSPERVVALEGGEPIKRQQRPCLLVKVHGVDVPSEEITNHLYRLIRNKLNSFTLQVLSTNMIRNPLSKLDADDILFLKCKQLDSPHAVVRTRIHDNVVDTWLYCSQVCQNLRQTMNLAHYQSKDLLFASRSSPSEEEEATEHPTSPSASPSSSSPSSTSFPALPSSVSTNSARFNPLESVFLYNYTHGPSPSNAHLVVGQGMAIIELRLQHKNGDASPPLVAGAYADVDYIPYRPLHREDDVKMATRKRWQALFEAQVATSNHIPPAADSTSTPNWLMPFCDVIVDGKDVEDSNVVAVADGEQGLFLTAYIWHRGNINING